MKTKPGLGAFAKTTIVARLIAGGAAIFVCALAVVFCSRAVTPILPRTTQYTHYYNAASVALDEIYSGCKSYRPIPGSDLVLEISHLEQGLNIAPDNWGGYGFFLQVSPELIQEGRELYIPDTGVRPFLSSFRAPICTPTENVKGRLRILRVQDTAIEGSLDAESQAGQVRWKYVGEIKFVNATIQR